MGSEESALRVVVGLDGSSSSHSALRWAVHQARLIGGVVDAITAWELPVLYGWPASAPMIDTDVDEQLAQRSLDEQLDEVLGESRPVEVRARVVRANPAEVLLNAAVGAELLVVGSRGRGTFARALLGSVSQQCALHETCPVAIVRPG
ncbi:universal stress protein [Kitasatospora paracochleata]|uniref:universal stress protein n=1 Tax=Kitasatospora paracochleata TaxID=58354 RepID=UPI0031D13324